MKRALLGILVVMASVQTMAVTTVCSMSRQSDPKKTDFDKNIFSFEVLKNSAKYQLIVVLKDGTIIENFEFDSLKNNINLLQKLDKALFAVVGSGENSQMSAGIGRFDLSNKENFSQMYSMALGGSETGISLIDYSHKLALSCTQQ